MAGRRRVSLRESFKIAAKGALDADDPSGGLGTFVVTIFSGDETA